MYRVILSKECKVVRQRIRGLGLFEEGVAQKDAEGDEIFFDLDDAKVKSLKAKGYKVTVAPVKAKEAGA